MNFPDPKQVMGLWGGFSRKFCSQDSAAIVSRVEIAQAPGTQRHHDSLASREVERQLRAQTKQPWVSLSHSAGLVIGIALDGPCDPTGIKGIGVDIERFDRPISQAVVARFTEASERTLGLSGIELWCAKEAIFKSAPRDQQGVITDYRLLSAHDAAAKNVATRFSLQVLTLDGWTIAFAVCH